MARRGYPAEYRLRVLKLIEAGRRVVEIAADLGISEQAIYTWRRQDRIDRQLEPGLASAERAELLAATVHVRQCLDGEIAALEKIVRERVKLRPEFNKLKSVPGIGDILALTIMLETGAIARFPSVGDFASYCRCVNSARLSNGKKKGTGNVKNGNRYLAWAFVEAAHFAIRFSGPIQRFYHRKRARTQAIVALKTVAHKLARAAYYILRDQVAFDVTKAFA